MKFCSDLIVDAIPCIPWDSSFSSMFRCEIVTPDSPCRYFLDASSIESTIDRLHFLFNLNLSAITHRMADVIFEQRYPDCTRTFRGCKSTTVIDGYTVTIVVGKLIDDPSLAREWKCSVIVETPGGKVERYDVRPGRPAIDVMEEPFVVWDELLASSPRQLPWKPIQVIRTDNGNPEDPKLYWAEIGSYHDRRISYHRGWVHEGVFDPRGLKGRLAASWTWENRDSKIDTDGVDYVIHGDVISGTDFHQTLVLVSKKAREAITYTSKKGGSAHSC